jgi:hypothetical protein
MGVKLGHSLRQQIAHKKTAVNREETGIILLHLHNYGDSNNDGIMG